MHYHYASAVAVSHRDRDIRRIGTKSDKLVHVLMVHVFHLQRTDNFIVTALSAVQEITRALNCQQFTLSLLLSSKNLMQNMFGLPVENADTVVGRQETIFVRRSDDQDIVDTTKTMALKPRPRVQAHRVNSLIVLLMLVSAENETKFDCISSIPFRNPVIAKILQILA